MKVKSFVLPYLFIEALSNKSLERNTGSWELLRNLDAYENFLETELGEVFCSVREVETQTDELPLGFQVDGYYGETMTEFQGPGAISDIIDFSKIICFAISSDGSPFCFDYRDVLDNPSIVWWDDTYWRRIAPDFESFIRLFNLEKNHTI